MLSCLLDSRLLRLMIVHIRIFYELMMFCFKFTSMLPVNYENYLKSIDIFVRFIIKLLSLSTMDDELNSES